MRNTLLTLLCALLSFLSLPAQYFNSATGRYIIPAGAVPGEDYCTDRFILRIKDQWRSQCSPDNIHIQSVEAVLNKVNVTLIRKAAPAAQKPERQVNDLGLPMIDLSLIYEIRYDGQEPVENILSALNALPEVEYADIKIMHRILYSPNDWDSTGAYYVDQINARPAWDLSKGDTNVVIAITDLGTSFIHFDLVNKHKYNTADPVNGMDDDNDGYIDNWRGWDFGGDAANLTGDNDPSWYGAYTARDHGVLVGGVATAETDNNQGIASIGFNCKQLPLKTNIEWNTAVTYGYEAIIYGADHGANVINMSWGSSYQTRFGQDAIDYAFNNHGCLLVAACGNTPAEIFLYPACYRKVIAVAATQPNDVIWTNSTYNYLVDICAPGSNIKTTAQDNLVWSGASGTSMSAPMVAGAAGLAIAHFPGENNIQAGERMRIHANNIYGNMTAIYNEKLGIGQLDVHAGLVQNSPSVRILDFEMDDNENGIIEIGDTVEIRVRFINYLDSVSNLTVTLGTPSVTTVEILDNTLFAGDVPTMGVFDNFHQPMKIRIKAGGVNARAFLRFGFDDGGSYQDFQYEMFTIRPSVVHLDNNQIETSVDAAGHFGYSDFPFNSAGKGFTHFSSNIMSEGGFLIGTSSTKVSDRIRNTGASTQDADFTTLWGPVRVDDGAIADIETYGEYNDAGAGVSQLNVSIREYGYSWQYAPDDDYIILEYVITNNGGSNVSNAYAGIFADFDLGWSDKNWSIFDSTASVIYGLDSVGVERSKPGLALLTNDPVHAYGVPIDSITLNTAGKFAALSAPASAGTDTTGADDFLYFISAGPFTIAPGDSHRVAFALVIGDSLPQLRNAAQKAKAKYDCVVRGNMTVLPNLGPDINWCDSDTSFLLDPGSGFTSYLWSDSSSNQTYLADSSATYVVWVTDGGGCTDYDVIEVGIEPFNGGFTLSSSNIFVNDTVFVTDTTTGASSRAWVWGDGGAGSILQTDMHQYTVPGQYPLSLIVCNGVCTDTITKVITVDTLLLTEAFFLEEDIHIYPVPATDHLTVKTGNISGPITWRLSAVDGKILKQGKENDQVKNLMFDIKLDELSQGMYFLEIQSSAGKATFRILKQ